MSGTRVRGFRPHDGWMRRTRLPWLAAALLIAGAPPAAAQAKALARGAGTYRNVDYGYRVRLPTGAAYERSPAPSPNHGFQVPVAAGDTLWVDASYTDSLTLAGAVRGAAALAEGCTVAGQRPTRLGALPARELVYRCPPVRRSGRARERREVLALRGGILYTVGIRGADGVSRSGANLFAAARAGFATTPR
jgi:hypothetical protein